MTPPPPDAYPAGMDGLYDSDFLLWSEQQATLLRRLAHGERVNDAVDWDNLIEEVGDLGRSQFERVNSQLRVALAHLLYIHGAPEASWVGHWRVEARTALDNAWDSFAPSMRQRLDLDRAWRSASANAADKLADLGAVRRLAPTGCPFTLDELLRTDPDLDALLARFTSGGAQAT